MAQPHAQLLKNILTRYLPNAETSFGENDTGADLEMRVGNTLFIVQITATSSRNIEDLTSRLAAAILVSERLARERKATPVALVTVPHLGPKGMASAARFVAQNKPGFAWGAFDARGNVRLVIPQLCVDVTDEGATPRTATPSTRNASLFTDLNQWLLKVLLLFEVDEHFWGGPRVAVRNRAALAQVAQVSTQKAYTFVSTFEAADLLRKTPKGLCIVDRNDLFDTWFRTLAQHPPMRVPVRWIFGESDPLDFLRDRKEDYALGGFHACDVHGVLFSPKRECEVHVFDPVATILDSWEMEVCDPRDAKLFLLPQTRAKSIRLGRVVREGVAIVDVLQAALDMAHHRAKGQEQADHIVKEVLKW